MKLASYRVNELDRLHSGVLVDGGSEEFLVDLAAAYTHYLRAVEHEERARELAEFLLPANMLELLRGGERSLDAARRASEFAADQFADLDRLALWERAGLARRPAEVVWSPPVPRPGKVIAAGANYRDHLAEAAKLVGRPLPVSGIPPGFIKWSSALIGHHAPIRCLSSEVDYEIELACYIGRRSRNVRAEDYLGAVVGYTIFNDVTARDFQRDEKQKGNGLIMLSKNLDSQGPTGPYLVTNDEIPDPQNLRLRLTVNGKERQNAHTSDMIFPVAEILGFYSQATLEPGDMISTGSPAGVALGSDDPELFLKPGDVVEAEIQGIGVLRNPVIAA